jgi:hypothetical protein
MLAPNYELKITNYEHLVSAAAKAKADRSSIQHLE